jgi:hypothetical protein
MDVRFVGAGRRHRLDRDQHTGTQDSLHLSAALVFSTTACMCPASARGFCSV